MATKPILAPLELAVTSRPRVARYTILSDYWVLTKPAVNFLIVITTFAGFYLGCADGREFPFWLSFRAVLGTLLVASGTGTLNQYIERRFDARMRRTSRRPLTAGRLPPFSALVRHCIYRCLAASIWRLRSIWFRACWRWPR